eukprot:130228-Pyramimonas_sp.AAC.1
MNVLMNAYSLVRPSTAVFSKPCRVLVHRVGSRLTTTGVVGRPCSRRTKLGPPTVDPHDKYRAMLYENDATLVIATGPAGTGKTMAACDVGIRKLENDEFDRMLVTRPTIPVGGTESLGYLPGTLESKMSPWVEHML